MPFNLGFGEILIILVVILLLFGAKRIPEVAGSLGKGITEFKRNMSDAQRAITEPVRDDRPSLGAADRPADAPPVAARDEDRPEPKRLLS